MSNSNPYMVPSHTCVDRPNLPCAPCSLTVTKKFDWLRLWESFKLTFCIIGVAGYAGELATMHLFFQTISILAIGGLLTGLYRMIEL